MARIKAPPAALFLYSLSISYRISAINVHSHAVLEDSPLTRISFYILAAEHNAGREGFACRLAEKAYHTGARTYLQTADQAVMQTLDTRLWEECSRNLHTGFIPHECWLGQADAAAVQAPLLLGMQEPPDSHHDVLINLSDDVPQYFSRFERLLEIIDANHPEAGRQRYQFYLDRGYPLQTHQIQATP